MIVSGLRERLIAERQALTSQVPEDRQVDQALSEYIDARAAVQVTLERTEEIIKELEAELKNQLEQISHITIEVKGITAS